MAIVFQRWRSLKKFIYLRDEQDFINDWSCTKVSNEKRAKLCEKLNYIIDTSYSSISISNYLKFIRKGYITWIIYYSKKRSTIVTVVH